MNMPLCQSTKSECTEYTVYLVEARLCVVIKGYVLCQICCIQGQLEKTD